MLREALARLRLNTTLDIANCHTRQVEDHRDKKSPHDRSRQLVRRVLAGAPLPRAYRVVPLRAAAKLAWWTTPEIRAINMNNNDDDFRTQPSCAPPAIYHHAYVLRAQRPVSSPTKRDAQAIERNLTYRFCISLRLPTKYVGKACRMIAVVPLQGLRYQPR